MRNVYLPAAHTDRDLVLAGQVSDAFGSSELYVSWSLAGAPGAPTVGAALRAAAPPAVNVLAEIVSGVAHIWSALIGSAPPARLIR